MVSPSHRNSPLHLARGLLVLAAGTGSLAAQLIDWEAALGANASAQSQFTAVEAVPGFMGTPDAAFVAGNFSGNLDFGPLPGFTNNAGQDGIVARLDDAGPWDVTWKLQALCSGDLTITDLALTPGGPFFVCGFFTQEADFGPFNLAAPVGQPLGFVAFGDPNGGGWQGAFEVPDLLPESIAIEIDPDVILYLTGPGVLAQALDLGGTPLWTGPLPNGTTTPTHLALPPDPGDFVLYVLAEDPAGVPTDEDVVLFALDRADGEVAWNRRMGSPGSDTAGGLAVANDGDPRVAFQSDDPNITYNEIPVPGIPLLPGVHALMLRVERSTRDLAWATPLGIMQTAGSQMTATGVAVDAVGNAYASAAFSGDYLIEEFPEGANQDAAILGVDGTGLLFEFQRSNGAAAEFPAGLSVPVRGLAVTVGQYFGDPSRFGMQNLPPLPGGPEQGFFAAAGPPPNQELLILRPQPPITLDDLITAINAPDVDAQIYHQILLDGVPEAVSVYLTPAQLAQLTDNLPPASFTIEPDFPLTVNGTTSSSGWALGHLNDASTAASPYSFEYVEPAQAVYVYLIDTAVGSGNATLQAALDTWFDGNANLTLEPTTLIRGDGDPTVSSVFEHGTRMLSLLAGPQTGAAVGTPVVVKNFDFYPNGTTSTASLLADAIDAAGEWHDDNAGCSPGVILVASGSVASGSSSILTTYIERARDNHGLAVILSAGNNGGNTNDYTPAENGSESGIVCVAASTESEGVESGSNTGADVDFYAPGEGVRVVNYTDPLLAAPGADYDSFTGTSASAALTCALAATHLSLNPWLTPEALETELAGDTYSTGGSTPIDLLQIAAAGPDFTGTYDDWADFFGLTDKTHAGDDDGDGWTNLEEYFYGLNACGNDHFVPGLLITYNAATDKFTLSFKMSSILLDPAAPGTLRDGSTLVIKDSTDLSSFSAVSGSMSVGGSSNGRTDVSYTDNASATQCHFRLELTPSTPSP